MRFKASRPERFAPTGGSPADDFAPLFKQMSRPLDNKVVRDGMNAMSRWLGAPGWRAPVR